MLNRAVLLKGLCFAVGAIVLLQAAQLAARKDPLRGVTVPSPPASVRPTNSEAQASPAAVSGAGPRPAPAGPKIPALVQARIDRIIASEILGPAPRAMPLTLLGIAGTNAFLRGTNGQTGLLAEGESLGPVKLIKIGTNRVLIEDAGQPKELTLFSGFGSESLLPHPKENPQ